MVCGLVGTFVDVVMGVGEGDLNACDEGDGGIRRLAWGGYPLVARYCRKRGEEV